MITKAQVKHIQSLGDKKYRDAHQQFVVEGEKMVAELLQSNLTIVSIYALPKWLELNSVPQNIETILIVPFELERISSLKTPNEVVAIVSIPETKNVKANLALLLDGIQDPGNLGSMIRIADWYSIECVYCSESCADVFNSKVIQASMGSIFRVAVQKCDLKELILSNKNIPTYAAVLEGNDVNTFSKIDKGFIIIGNESKGISELLISLSTHKISIIRKGQAESLNAAIATGIICHCMLS